MPTVEIKCVSKTKWGKGTYKLNNSILKLEYVKHEFYNCWQLHKETKQNFSNSNEWWEKGKLIFKECLKKISIEINSSNKKIIEQTKLDLSNLLKENSNQNKNKIDSLKKQLEKLYENKYEGARVRAKLKKLEDETPDKYFFEKEVYQGKINTLDKINNQNKQTLYKPKKILQEIKKYYEELWGNCTKNNENEIASYLEIIENLAFYNHEITQIDNWITEHEVQFAINQLNNNFSPRSDGLTAEFYKTFQKLIIPELTEVFNNILLNKELPNSMKEATIKLLYKKNDHKNLKNWRPISLLNNDYKILSKIIVNRLSPLLQNSILPQQNAGIPGRKIENVHYNIQAILEMAEQWGEKIILMTVDFEKAFDKNFPPINLQNS